MVSPVEFMESCTDLWVFQAAEDEDMVILACTALTDPRACR